ncbi:ArsR/SmtB family transcription factor [Deinococcus aquaedulcis]|uniref:ArsR/SmtB family transcription factor n=1 Tax=Deinococcus aquaedulcis TaxID=2840455 RepID=UPI001C829D11|nr:helix-turn-helix domain-containing protein [Deinococcus aquaedulcis]
MLPDAFTARTPEQARLLLAEDALDVLGPLVPQALSASEVARRCGRPLKTTHHHLTRLLGAGLVTVAGERPRDGRPIKLYRAVARTFRVPFALTPHATVEELLARVGTVFVQEVTHELARLFAGDSGTELIMATDALGQLGMSVAPQTLSGAPPHGAVGNMGRRTLTPQSQRELETRLRDLLAWVDGQATADQAAPGAQPCLLGLLFTPVQGGHEP